MNFDPVSFFPSMIWSAIALGYFVYGKKQQSTMPLVGGAAMGLVTYFVDSWLWMSLICIGIMVAIHVLMRRDY